MTGYSLRQVHRHVETETNSYVARKGDVCSQVMNLHMDLERNNQVLGLERTLKPFNFSY